MKIYPTTVLVTVMAFLNVGCSSINPNASGWNPFSQASDHDNQQANSQPASMAVIWKDSVFEKPGVPSVKGFGGRMFIYDANNEPIRAEGELIVYGYDESKSEHKEEHYAGADKKFVFPREKFQQHFSQSDLGPSYSVWVPWEKVGGIRKSITLIPVFKTADGRILRSGHSINVLPGKKPESSQVVDASGVISNSKNLVAQASFQKPNSPNLQQQVAQASQQASLDNGKPRLRTTTLNLPPALANKLAAAQPTTHKNEPAPFPRPNDPAPSANGIQNGANSSPQPSAPPASSLPKRGRIFGVPGSF